MGCDLVTPKLVKIAADKLASPITQSIFPNKAKEPSIISAGERRNDINTFSNCVTNEIFHTIYR